ncbi:MAG: MBL fold metallo-hydrolase [Zoogloeaceae bacterium]|nr:MBL fold metallo-hydrolase [Zoogloeaceae bacterium]
MKTTQTIFEAGSHKWTAIVRDPQKPDFVIDTNEYLVQQDGKGLLIDPGGSEIFPAVFSALSADFDASRIVGIFASHQDPDIISSLALWLEFNPAMKCYVNWLWAGFIPHFGGAAETFVSLPDESSPLALASLQLQTVPAHYLHSSGNLHLYDKKAKLLFSGDVGAALLPAERQDLFVEDFSSHIRFAEGFHKRWMGSNEAKRQWCERVAQLDIDMLCPQHGAIYRGTDVQRFINWFDELRVGVLRG